MVCRLDKRGLASMVPANVANPAPSQWFPPIRRYVQVRFVSSMNSSGRGSLILLPLAVTIDCCLTSLRLSLNPSSMLCLMLHHVHADTVAASLANQPQDEQTEETCTQS
jgi:hypothetical protein